MAEQFGKTWWGQKWLQALNNIDYSNRLPRGASYARKGAVKQINIKDNRIQAKVIGSRPSPYKVDIILPPFFDPQLSDFIDSITEKPLIISKLLNRELDPELLDMAEKAGLKVFPEQWTDFKMQCNCPDWAVPCKHLASVIYKTSAEIDNNPFLVFELHLLNLIEELHKRGFTFSTKTIEIPKLKELYFESKKDSAKESFDIKQAYQKLPFSCLSPIHEPLLSLLSEFPVFYNQSSDFKVKYTTIINRVVKNADKVLKRKLSLSDIAKQTSKEITEINTHSVNQVLLDETFEAIVRVNDEDFMLSNFIAKLSQIPSNKTLDYQPSTASLHSLLQLSLHLISNGAIVPQIIQQPDKTLSIRWLPAMLSKDVRLVMDKLSQILPPDIFWWKMAKTEKAINKDVAINLLSVFLTEIVSLLSGSTSNDLFQNLFFKNKEYAFDQPGESESAGGIQTWLQKYYLSQGKIRPQIVVSEYLDDDFLIAINVQSPDNDGSFIPLKEILDQPTYEELQLEVLQTMATLCVFVHGLEEHINTKCEKPIQMDSATFTPFLLNMIPIIRLLDIDILLPKSLQEILKPKPSLKIKKKPGKSFLRLEQLLEFDWQIAIGDTLMDEDTFKKLLNKSDGLIKYKSQYIYVNSDELEKLHKHFSGNSELNSFQLLRSALSGEYFGEKVNLDESVIQMINELGTVENIELPQDLNAQLRPYQHRGFSWMYRNAKIGFGSVIADDMGLGKTLQVITTLLKYKEEGLLGTKKALVITPTGLLTNWQAEIKKFAPSLITCLFHGSNRKIEPGYDILLTSYGIARTEASKLKKMPWMTVIIDEAQNIKNQDTAQAKAIKSIKADNFIAMSGTPVENRLSELWSIMDFSNRGLLGTQKEFATQYGTPIETYNDLSTAEKLKKISAPFLMRRLKTDKTIISDLPDKIEMDTYGSLVGEQASLYEKTLEEALMAIEAIDPSNSKELFVRQGLVLQMILALKQICNHPTQFLKNKRMDATLSGKTDLLFEKLDSIRESGEKVLIFTQFKEMGNLLQHFIEERYAEKPLFYHGGCTLKQRKEMVEQFQHNPADKIFILSLKAAGTGLNLTAANHVIHYDLWWNPAVEAQATDRAYRIGQKSNVMVHRFITKNTFEERINSMIQSKKALAEMTVSTGENWIGNLSNKELKELFELN
ncbi:SNF2-related protein [Belliella sp. DSM 111904]|uniref:SNF2-related protein n=1 Tax=Belliella filtrata TaxID=2923435 RepID=A0ABS9V3S5_9BACT|nr:SNF2-related protein [Belliella filtrata]MCH7411067.1 SNF2-related protein [Belliella filtrata]